MQQSNNPRKRPAPGTVPIAQQSISAQPQFQYQQMPQMPENSGFGNYDFNPFQDQQTYSDATFSDPNQLSAVLNQAQPSTLGASAPSTDLVRRTWNQQLASQAGQQEQRDGFSGANGQQEEETEQDLDAKVALAKRDAQGKRKQIPPFVQKLSSFLDSGNTDLIRWSDDGRSFIVIDEDEFARTLIPELFKHNNYASFVRQLNMYGFHKTVNITDGSLRQSEKARKGVKPPSMYSHPYFRKNRPDLLWLIQKPTGKPNAKRKREGDAKDGYGSDDDRQFSPGPEGQSHAGAGGGGLTTLPRTELVTVRSELKKLQQQQQLISRMIAQLKEQNDQFYRQATAFQALHDRHENSINAILTFLATFYNRSLEGHAGQNLVNMFSNVGQNNQQQSGGVVEEFNESTPETQNQLQRYIKRPQLLLPGPEQSASPRVRPGSAAVEANSARASTSPPNDAWKPESPTNVPPPTAPSSETTSPTTKTDAPTPNHINQAPENDHMMNLINNVNASNASTPNASAPAFDFSSALDHYQTANGNAPLTPQQRDDMLAMIANQHGGNPSNNNALISPTPPTMPDLNQLKQTQQQLEMLTNMQKQQDAKVQDLHRRLQPLSPTGTIPGLHGDDDNPFDLTGAPGDYDPNSFLDYSGGDDGNFDFGSGGDNDDFDWNFGQPPTGADVSGADMFQTDTDPNNNSLDDLLNPKGAAGGRVESVSSGAPTPLPTVEEIKDDAEELGTPNKRQRVE